LSSIFEDVESLQEEVKALRQEIERLKAQSPKEVHHHHYYWQGYHWQPCKPWGEITWGTASEGVSGGNLICASPSVSGDSDSPRSSLIPTPYGRQRYGADQASPFDSHPFPDTEIRS
jgi:hypothetical protein